MDEGDRTEDSARDQDIGSHTMVSLRLRDINGFLLQANI
jgi:hypothetical protein